MNNITMNRKSASMTCQGTIATSDLIEQIVIKDPFAEYIIKTTLEMSK